MNVKITTQQIVLIALMSAVLCILGPLSLPLFGGLVPVTLTNLAIYLILYILGMKRGTISYLIYFLIGMVGLPVFSGFSGGLGKITGPTGGYLIGFFFLALIAGFCIDKWQNNMFLCLIGMLLGTAVCYLFGTAWLSCQAGYTFAQALAVGVIPFIAGDCVKMVLAMILGPQIRKHLKRAGLI